MIRHAVVLALAVVTLSGCGQLSASSSDAAPATEPPTSPLPPRPSELPLNGIDPCSALTAEQQRTLGLGTGRAGASSDGLGSPACIWSKRTEPTGSYLVRLVTGRGADSALSSNEASITSIAGFAAVSTTDTSFPAESHCVLFVDIAAGQTLVLRYDHDSSETAMSRDEACDAAADLGEMVIEGLERRAGG
jgi:hypothetical protein